MFRNFNWAQTCMQSVFLERSFWSCYLVQARFFTVECTFDRKISFSYKIGVQNCVCNRWENIPLLILCEEEENSDIVLDHTKISFTSYWMRGWIWCRLTKSSMVCMENNSELILYSTLLQCAFNRWTNRFWTNKNFWFQSEFRWKTEFVLLTQVLARTKAAFRTVWN